MVAIFPVSERDKKTSVRDRLHLREKPLRIERSLGPAIAPAQRRNGRLAEFRAFSSSSRTMRPLGTPVLRAASSSHSARSSGSRTLIALLICSNVTHALVRPAVGYRLCAGGGHKRPHGRGGAGMGEGASR